MVEKSTCSNCQNKPQKTPNTVQKPPVYDDEAFMKYDGTGVFATGLFDFDYFFPLQCLVYVLLGTVKLGDKEWFYKDQIGVKEPIPVTNCQFTT